MPVEVITALIAGASTIAGAFLGVLASSKLVNFRIKQLERQFAQLSQHVKEHNNFMERIAQLELGNRVQDHRIADLEALHKTK